MDGVQAFADVLQRHGWAHTPGLVERSWCEGAVASWVEEVRSFEGPLLRQLSGREEVHARSADGFVLNPVHNPHTLGAAFPRFAALPGALLEQTALVALAAAALGEPVALLQSAFYESALGTAPHRDEHPVDPDGGMLGAWVALEDVVAEAGPFAVWPGTHLLDDPALAAASRASWTARFAELAPSEALDAEVAALLEPHLKAVPGQAPLVAAGDVIWWDRRLVHGSLAPVAGSGRSRCSLVMHFVTQASLGPVG